MVWIATKLAYKVVQQNLEYLQHEKRPIVQWEKVFDQLRFSDHLVKMLSWHYRHRLTQSLIFATQG